MNRALSYRLSPAILWTLGLLYAILSPGSGVPKLPTFPGFDKLVHFGLFFGLVFLWARVWNNKPAGKINLKKIILNYLVFGIILAIFTEYLQAYVPNRSFDYADIGANITGGTIATVLFVYLNKKRSILV